MIPKAMAFVKSLILRQIKLGKPQLSRIRKAKKIPSISPPTIGYATKVDDFIPVVDYSEIKDLRNYPKKMLIDVREPNEVQTTGQIPNSINIPLRILTEALAIDGDSKDFQKKYGRPKPELDTYIIMTCHAGGRARIAARQARSLGYKKVHNYEGSWLDWASNERLKGIGSM